MKLAKIYYKEDLIQIEKLKYVEYIKINNIEEIDFTDKKYYNIIVGWNLVKNLKNVNILNNRISNNYFWVFSFSEKKSDYFLKLNNVSENIFFFHYNKFNKINIKLSELVNIVNNSSIIFINNNNILYYIENKNMHICNIKEEYFFYGKKTNLVLLEIKDKVKNIFHDKNAKFQHKIINYFENVDIEHIKILLAYFYYLFFYKK